MIKNHRTNYPWHAIQITPRDTEVLRLHRAASANPEALEEKGKIANAPRMQ